MVKKMLVLGVALVMLFLFTACGYPTEKFNSLTELQEAFPKDVYYFDFNQEGIKEAGKFELTKTSKNGGYIRYSVWYDIEYEIDGQKQERKLRIIASDIRYSISLNYKSTEAFRPIVNPIYNSWIDTIEIVEFNWGGLNFDENKKALTFFISIASHSYFYDFVLEGGVQASLVEHELESFLSICKFAIDNMYQIS